MLLPLDCRQRAYIEGCVREDNFVDYFILANCGELVNVVKRLHESQVVAFNLLLLIRGQLVILLIEYRAEVESALQDVILHSLDLSW